MAADGNVMTLEVLYQHVDRFGIVPQINERFPCDEALTGSLLVVEKKPIVRAGRPVGWFIKGTY